MKAYQFLFCDCIYESSFATMSLHRTKKGAYKAMNKFLNDRFSTELDERIKFGKFKEYVWKVGVHQAWSVDEIELLD